MAQKTNHPTRPTATFHDMVRTMQSVRAASSFEPAARDAE